MWAVNWLSRLVAETSVCVSHTLKWDLYVDILSFLPNYHCYSLCNLVNSIHELHSGKSQFKSEFRIMVFWLNHFSLSLLDFPFSVPKSPFSCTFPLLCLHAQSLCRVQLFATLWTVAHQAPLSMEFSSQEYWSGLPFPSPEDLPNLGIKPWSPALQANCLLYEPQGKPLWWPNATLKHFSQNVHMWVLWVSVLISLFHHMYATVAMENQNQTQMLYRCF